MSGCDTSYWKLQCIFQSDGKYHYVPFEFHVYYKLINDCCQTDMNANPIEPGYFSAFPTGFRSSLHIALQLS